jgi:hypothetical protein
MDEDDKDRIAYVALTLFLVLVVVVAMFIVRRHKDVPRRYEHRLVN